MRYESGMQIIYDVVGKRAMIIFRGDIFDLPGPYFSQQEATIAGEKKCRELGWKGQEADKQSGRDGKP